MSPFLPAPAPPIFDFKDPKEISAVSLSIDSPLEPIIGWAKGISGTLAFDPAHPEQTKGTVAVDVATVTFANDGYTATARGYALNEKKWPQLTLAIRGVEGVKKTSPTRYEGIVVADFTCRGIVQEKRLQVTADYFPNRAEERTNGQHKGDLLVLRTEFDVSRKAHGISEGIPEALVGDTIKVGIAVVGIHYAEPATLPTPTLAVPAKPKPEVAKPEATKPDAELDAPLARIGEGAPLSLNAAREGKPLVIFFLNEQCGVTVFYRDRLRRLVTDYAAKGFAFAAVRTGRKQFADRPVALPEREYLKIPFLDDADGALMRRFEVTQSMTFALLDRTGETRYFGGFDDHVGAEQVRRTPLREALDDLAADRPVREPRFRMLGCAILPVER